MTFTAIHASGKAGRPLPRSEQALDAYGYQAEGGIITTTEQGGQDARRPAIYRNADWSFYRSDQDGGRDECAVMWGDRFVLDGDPEDVRLTDRPVTRGNAQGQRHAPVYATTVPLRSAKHPRRRLVVSVAHLPVPSSEYRQSVWDEACQTWVRHLSRQSGRILVRADWNRSLRRNPGRGLVEARVGRPLGLRPAWDGHLPPKGQGTHGANLIDGDLTNLQVVDCRLLTDLGESDHRGYASVLGWPDHS